MLVEMHIIRKRFHCFFICSCENQKCKSDKNDRQIVLKERIKENNLGLQVAGLTDRFTRNESIVNMGEKEHQYKESVLYSRFLLYFNLFFHYRNFAERFPLS